MSFVIEIQKFFVYILIPCLVILLQIPFSPLCALYYLFSWTQVPNFQVEQLNCLRNISVPEIIRILSFISRTFLVFIFRSIVYLELIYFRINFWVWYNVAWFSMWIPICPFLTSIYIFGCLFLNSESVPLHFIFPSWNTTGCNYGSFIM